MKISEIKTAEPFNRIFPISDKVLASVVMDMRKNEFDPCHPVILWKDKHIVVDGHTRLEAARLVGLQDIPVVERNFQDEDAAVEYAIRCQRERRNLTDADIIRLVEELDARRQRGGDHTSEKAKASSEAIAPAGKSADETARIIGTSRAKVEKVRAIQAKAAPKVKAAVEAGQTSINKAYKTTKAQPAAKSQKSPLSGSDHPRTQQEVKLSPASDITNKVISLLQSIPANATDKASSLYSIMHWCATLGGSQDKNGNRWICLSASNYKKFVKWEEASANEVAS